MKNKSLTSLKSLLVFLIASLSITGIGLCDAKIWELIMVILGVTTYATVSILYSIHALSGRGAGKDAYAVIFIILIFLGYCVYQGIIKLQQWVLSWPLVAKMIIPSVIILCIVVSLVAYIIKQQERLQ